MKKSIWLILFALILCGCGVQRTMETISDELIQPVMAQPAAISVDLPGEAALPAMESDAGRIYLCKDYEICVQTLEGGNLNATVRNLSGMDKEQLTILETEDDGLTRYEFVWAAAGEKGDRVGRAAILDDGNYHYCLSLLRDEAATESSQISWDQIFSSFTLS